MTHRGQNNGLRNPVQIGLDSHYTREGHEDEAEHVLQPTLKNCLHYNWIRNGPLEMTGYLYRYESHSLSVQSHDNELESADKTGDWELDWPAGQGTRSCHGNEGHTLEAGVKNWICNTVAVLDGWPREHTGCTILYMQQIEFHNPHK